MEAKRIKFKELKVATPNLRHTLILSHIPVLPE